MYHPHPHTPAWSSWFPLSFLRLFIHSVCPALRACLLMSGCGCHFIQFLTFAQSWALGSCMEPLLQGDYYRFYIYSSYWTLAVYLCTCIRASGVVRFRACEKVGVLGLAQSSTFWSVFYATNASGSLNCSNCARAVATFSLPLVCEVSWAELQHYLQLATSFACQV